MQGIEMARAFYEQSVRLMIERDFAQYTDRIAVGLVGHGSECFGYDDEISRDHDFEPSLCIWLDDDDEREFGFALFRAYSKLCKEYCGKERSAKSRGDSDFRGVMTVSDFYRRYTGRAGAPQSNTDWLYTPSYYLAEATNGEVFCDPKGVFTSIRNEIKNGMPEDVRLKKICSCAFYMAQSGQYNFKRCLAHGELGASRLALSDFVKSSMEMIFLLNRAHMPYYKWSFRAMRELCILGDRACVLEQLLVMTEGDILAVIEALCADVISELRRQGLTDSASDYLENHAYSVNGKIKDAELRNMPVML